MGWVKRTFSSFVRKYVHGKELEDKGERVDIRFSESLDFAKLDVYEKSHFRRYEFAEQHILSGSVCGDMACGSGYGSAILSRKAARVVGVDIDPVVIDKITQRYASISNLELVNASLLNIDFCSEFDTIVSFETVEHLQEEDIPSVMRLFSNALKPGGMLIVSTPYMQERSEAAIKMGFHKTFDISEDTVAGWLIDAGLTPLSYKYQDYSSHDIRDERLSADFVICIAQKP